MARLTAAQKLWKTIIYSRHSRVNHFQFRWISSAILDRFLENGPGNNSSGIVSSSSVVLLLWRLTVTYHSYGALPCNSAFNISLKQLVSDIPKGGSLWHRKLELKAGPNRCFTFHWPKKSRLKGSGVARDSVVSSSTFQRAESTVYPAMFQCRMCSENPFSAMAEITWNFRVSSG